MNISGKMPFFSKEFPFIRQPDAMDCGPVCLQMIAEYYGKHIPLPELRKMCHLSKQGTTLASLGRAAEQLGFKTLAAELPYEKLMQKVPLPCILHWDQEHYVILYRTSSRFAYIANPALDGNLKLSRQDFLNSWAINHRDPTGRVLMMEPTPVFQSRTETTPRKVSLWSLAKYLKSHRKNILPIILSLLLASGFSLAVPFLTQQIVDKGIHQKSTDLLLLICGGQLMLFSGRMVMDFLRARWLFKIGAKTSIVMLKDFIVRLMRLPFGFFDNRQAADNMQRVNDNQRIEDFLTSSVIGLIMSVITLLVMGGVLIYYNWKIFFIFILGAALSILWSNSFKQRRKIIDLKKFKLLSANQQLLLEIFYAMQEIKLTGSEEEKKQVWESHQDASYDLKMDSLVLDQMMQGVSSFINEFKNVIITYVAAMLVVHGDITLGGMLAVTYICGQLNAPTIQIIEFIRIAQNTKFTLQRMNEVHREVEEDADLPQLPLSGVPTDIEIEGLSFHYGGEEMPDVLKDIHAKIPAGKVTAIVGMSGSGKTTLMKLLLKFYQPNTGTIRIGEQTLDQVHARIWRQNCGVVMQDGYIFMDTIFNNISVGCKEKKMTKIYRAAQLANMHDFFLSLPFGYDTVVGREGYGLSEGQKQRLLIARLIYRDPPYIFLDEATNSLDAHNELEIVHNLTRFFLNKTVIIIAHRLSTVKNADQIIVLEQGRLIESGDHRSLIDSQGGYYRLIKNQLELGK